jgi:3-oxoacyl-(acyl-carrier-protein) synthase
LSFIPLYPIKSIIGECFTASGPLQCIAAVYASNYAGQSTKTISHNAQEKINNLMLPDKIAPCNKALVYTFGLDGTFAAVVVGKV